MFRILDERHSIVLEKCCCDFKTLILRVTTETANWYDVNIMLRQYTTLC